MWKLLSIFFSVLLVARAQFVHDGECRSDVEVVQDFDLDKYMGKWYEVQRYEVYFQRGSECSQALYTKAEDGTTVIVENSSIKNGQPRTWIRGTAVLVGDAAVGKLSVAFHHKTPGTEPNYWILGTDYENYAVVWNCFNFRNGKSSDVAWILSRTPELSADVQEAVNAIIAKYLDESKLRTTLQDAETCGY